MENIKTRTPQYLVIDDDLNFCKIVKAYGKSVGVGITYIDSVEKLETLSGLKFFDAILIDYDLEGMTGFEVAEILSVKAAIKPIVMISATNRPYQDQLARLPNIVGFVSKWGKVEDFFAKVVETVKTQPGITVKNSAVDLGVSEADRKSPSNTPRRYMRYIVAR
ncbi:response regulator [Oligoflexaceae bacterium]|nr:response regulator [Oligoflexaceae bacterium]